MAITTYFVMLICIHVCPCFNRRQIQPRSLYFVLSSLPPLSLVSWTTKEAEKRDPGNEVASNRGMENISYDVKTAKFVLKQRIGDYVLKKNN